MSAKPLPGWTRHSVYPVPLGALTEAFLGLKKLRPNKLIPRLRISASASGSFSGSIDGFLVMLKPALGGHSALGAASKPKT
jgi:hypothetical protein